MRCKNCGVSVACSVFDGEVELVDLKTGRAHHCRTTSGVAALVGAARTLCEHFESDEGCSVEDFKNVEAALGELR